MSAAPVPRWLAFGVEIASRIAIPGALPLACSGREPTVTIEVGPAALPAPATEHGPYRLSGDSFLFEAAGVARYLCNSGSRITIEPAAGADEEMVTALLVATVLPALLWTRGDIVLHAAAAVLPGTDRAVAILGISGSGKSTVLARLAAAGAAVVADDAICVRRDGDHARISGLPGRIYEPLNAARRSRGYRAVDTDAALPDARLGVILVLDRDAPGIEPLVGVAALTALLRHRHRPAMARLTKREPALLPRFTALAALPIYRVPGATV